jgi:hypothetical protein
MVRTSIFVLSLSWIAGFTAAGMAQTEPAPVNGPIPSPVANDCGTGNCDGGNYGANGSWVQRSQAHYDLIKQHADLIAQRNDAWPKPFLCYDRQSYHSIFAVMTQRGWQCECTLTGDHFDSQTQELNRAGKAKIHGIMTNLPEVARQVHVYRDSTAAVAEARMANVRAEIQHSFEALPEPALAITSYMPHGMNGSLVEDVQKRFVENLPDPAVPAAKTTTISTQ